MSDLVPGTLVEMRVIRRYSHYMVGERIAVPMPQAQELAAKRLAQPLQLMVPAVATPGGDPPDSPVPQRQPGAVVRK